MPYLGHKEGAFWFYWGLVFLGVITIVTYRKDAVSLSAGIVTTLIGVAMLLLRPIRRGGWPLVRFAVLAGAIVSAVSAIVAAWESHNSRLAAILAVLSATLNLVFSVSTPEFFGRWLSRKSDAPPPITLTAENGLGKALIRIENRGARATFTATATVVQVIEKVANPKFLHTYRLRWRSNDKDEITIERGAVETLLIATCEKTVHQAGQELYEMRLQGFDEGKPAPVDWFRWNWHDEPGAVTIDLDVTVSPRAGQGAATRRFRVTNRKLEGILIEALPAGA